MMPKKPVRPSYPDEFRRHLIEPARSGVSPEAIATRFELTAQTIRRWVRQADLDDGDGTDGLTTEERDELARLRRVDRTPREGREILENATAWFAPETQSTPSNRSGL